MPVIRVLLLALPFLKKALRDPRVRRRLGLKPLTRKQLRQQRREAGRNRRR